MDFPLVKVIKSNITVEIDYMHPQEQEVVRALLNVVIVEGKTYPQKQPLSPAEFSTYWLNKDAFVVIPILHRFALNYYSFSLGVLGVLGGSFKIKCIFKANWYQDICFEWYTQAKKNIRGVLFKTKLPRSMLPYLQRWFYCTTWVRGQGIGQDKRI